MNVRLFACLTVALSTAPLAAATVWTQGATNSFTNSNSYYFTGTGVANTHEVKEKDSSYFKSEPKFNLSPFEAKSGDEFATQSYFAGDAFEWQGRTFAKGHSQQSPKGTLTDHEWGDATSAYDLTFELTEPTEFHIRWETFGEVARAAMSTATFARASLSITMGAVSELSILHTDHNLARVTTQTLLLPAGTHTLSTKVESFAEVQAPWNPETYSADVTAKLTFSPAPEPSTIALAGLGAAGCLAAARRGRRLR